MSAEVIVFEAIGWAAAVIILAAGGARLIGLDRLGQRVAGNGRGLGGAGQHHGGDQATDGPAAKMTIDHGSPR